MSSHMWCHTEHLLKRSKSMCGRGVPWQQDITGPGDVGKKLYPACIEKNQFAVQDGITGSSYPLRAIPLRASKYTSIIQHLYFGSSLVLDFFPPVSVSTHTVYLCLETYMKQ